MIKAVLFDLDGTFADTAPDLAASLNHVRATRNLPPLPLEALRPQASHGSRGLLKTGFGIEPDHPDYAILRNIFLEYYAQHICIHTRLFDGMPQLLSDLDKRTIPWGIVTNKPHRYTVPLMEALGFSERTACLVSGDTCAHSKPHSEPMLMASKLIGIPPENCLYAGDDLRDMQAANAAGMHGIIANYGYVSSDASIKNWSAYGSIDRPMELIDYLTL